MEALFGQPISTHNPVYFGWWSGSIAPAKQARQPLSLSSNSWSAGHLWKFYRRNALDFSLYNTFDHFHLAQWWIEATTIVGGFTWGTYLPISTKEIWKISFTSTEKLPTSTWKFPGTGLEAHRLPSSNSVIQGTKLIRNYCLSRI